MINPMMLPGAMKTDVGLPPTLGGGPRPVSDRSGAIEVKIRALHQALLALAEEAGVDLDTGSRLPSFDRLRLPEMPPMVMGGPPTLPPMPPMGGPMPARRLP